ncbi:MlaD family protein [Polluticoccus soli]|uniref:MlaD family protein n=1 Tax=Polluticoccus soli TaxID=3034150 RepID=UPI0023E0A597|nr:MlaD family protein [Flavipsychrobacter sp. JY13-12]
MRAANRRQSVILGIFISLGFVILFAGAFVLNGQKNTFEKTITVSAVFADVKGLLKGSNIWLSGIKIGTVKRIEFTGYGLAKVEMRIDEDSRRYISKDARAKISTDGVIGNPIVVIYGGTPNTPTVVDKDTLQTETGLSRGQMMNTLEESNQNLSVITSDFKTISRRLVAGEGTAGKLLTEDNIARQLEATSANLQNASVIIQRLSSNLADYSTRLHNKGTMANELVTDTFLYHNLKTAATDIREASLTARETTDNLNKMSHDLKDSNNVASVLLYDQGAANKIRAAINNIQCGTKKFDEDMEALQSNFLFRKFFKKRAQQQKNKPVDSTCQCCGSTSVR